MLGEDHSLLHEFPEYQQIIEKLIKNDDTFAKDTKQYNSLDKEIRTLELNKAPIDDDAMNTKKLQRAALKDALYQRLLDRE